jgi:hypothetical protein
MKNLLPECFALILFSDRLLYHKSIFDTEDVIPEFDKNGNSWGSFLPIGWDNFSDKFGTKKYKLLKMKG